MISIGAAAVRRLKSDNSFSGFLLLYVMLYAAYGTESAYLPSFLGGRGLSVEQIGVVLAAGTVVRIFIGPLIGRLADYLSARKRILAIAAASSSVVGLGYNAASGFIPLLSVSMAHAAATASLGPLSDALAVTASADNSNFRYGWVRGAGSAAFVGGTLLSGQLVERFGLSAIIVTSSMLFLLLAIWVEYLRFPPLPATLAEDTDAGGFSMIWRLTAYRRLVLAAMLVIGSHALNDAFAVIHWREAGYGNLAVSLLWSESVVAEVVVFFLVGPWLIRRLGFAGAASLSAGAGILRWGVMATTSAPSALICVQGLHGLTFALMHLSAMGVIAHAVPVRLAATAQTIYGTGALGIASALLTVASGYLVGWFGTQAFWGMAALCAVALPLAASIGDPTTPSKSRMQPA